MSSLVVEDLQKRFQIDTGGKGLKKNDPLVVHAVNGVSFEVASGEILAVVGESGCGKSTVARMLVGLVDPTAGTIRVSGQELGVSRGPSERRLIQLVSQNPWAALNRRRTIGHALDQALLVNGIGSGSADRRRRVEEMIARVGLSRAHLRSRPADVSGGELARAVLARALLLEPRVLILDEPTASLDASVKATVVNLLRRLRAELDIAIVLITHELGVARALADNVAVMYLGRLVEIGRADLVLGRPAHPYTRLLMSSVPDAEPGQQERPVARGEVPSAVAPPPGCAFHPRCDLVSAECGWELPVLEGHAGVRLACHRVTDLGMPRLMPHDHPEAPPREPHANGTTAESPREESWTPLHSAAPSSN